MGEISRVRPPTFGARLPEEPCALCGSATTQVRGADGGFGRFFACPSCGLVQRARGDQLSVEQERAFYATHQNDFEDERYRSFLERLALPIQERIRAGARGLDFGCGPVQVLGRWFEERGFPTVSYDPLFAPSPEPLQEKYAFVSCSEVVEHFREPRASWRLLFSLLEPGGLLGVMTEWYRDQVPLESWRYARDPTHLCFYRPATLQYLADQHNAHVTFAGPNVCLFTVPDEAPETWYTVRE